MVSIKFLLFLALAIACVFAAEPERVKKDVLIGGPYPYAYSGLYAGAIAPTAYSAGFAHPAAYSAFPYAGYGSYFY